MRLYTLLLVFFFSPLTWSQSITSASSDSEKAGKRLQECLFLSKQGDLPKAETRVLAEMSSEVNTNAWHIEAASRLLQVAFLAKESGDLPLGKNLAELSIRHLDRADVLSANDLATQAATANMRASISENFTGNSSEAAALRASAKRLRAQAKQK